MGQDNKKEKKRKSIVHTWRKDIFMMYFSVKTNLVYFTYKD